jgi:GH15 family glucan-1,4-alpha-glucosidase
MSSLELGVIGNCQIASLIDRNGRHVWTCWPRLDGDPIFCSLINGATRDESAVGFYDVVLDGCTRSEQAYLRNTAMLRTTLYDDRGGAVRLDDFAPRFGQYGRMFRPTMLVRRITPISGRPIVRIRLRPASDYGASRPAISHGSNHIRFETRDSCLRLTTDASFSAILDEHSIILDEPLTLILGPDESIRESLSKVGRDFFCETRSYWTDWTRGLSIPFEWQEEVIRAAITLKLCTYEDSGAVVAALTTSIPEAANTTRNWDYRFCWLRDSYYVVHALNRLGATRTMESYLGYIVDAVKDLGPTHEIEPLFGLTRNAQREERTIETLSGYRAMAPVRVGNQAYRQRQNDSYGAVILAATQYFFDSRLHRQGNIDDFRRLEDMGRRALSLHNIPDAGIWEYRGRERVHTYSSVMCWAACDRLSRIARRLQLADDAHNWLEAAETIRRYVWATAWDVNRAALVESSNGRHLDASLLILADLGFVSGRDPRFVSTVQAVGERLRRGNYLYRYEEPDDFGTPETSFNICTFWYINALAAIGRREEARDMFAQMLANRTALGLLSEDIDPRTGELWGNFPQTYSMVGIINAAMKLSDSWESAL